MIIKYKKITVVLVLICFIVNFTGFVPETNSAIIPAGMGTIKSSFGGKITQTIDCSTPTCCAPTAPEFPICLVIRCILGNPFIQHTFDNYTSTEAPDAFDQLLDSILEPQERQNCPSMCAPLGLVHPLACAAFCGALVGLQKKNKSPAGQAVEAMRKATKQAGVTTPGIVMAYQPMNILPACNPTRPFPPIQYILGQGLGQGLYITQPGDQIGDNCAGHYYPMMAMSP